MTPDQLFTSSRTYAASATVASEIELYKRKGFSDAWIAQRIANLGGEDAYAAQLRETNRAALAALTNFRPSSHSLVPPSPTAPQAVENTPPVATIRTPNGGNTTSDFTGASLMRADNLIYAQPNTPTPISLTYLSSLQTQLPGGGTDRLPSALEIFAANIGRRLVLTRGLDSNTHTSNPGQPNNLPPLYQNLPPFYSDGAGGGGGGGGGG